MLHGTPFRTDSIVKSNRWNHKWKPRVCNILGAFRCFQISVNDLSFLRYHFMLHILFLFTDFYEPCIKILKVRSIHSYMIHFKLYFEAVYPGVGSQLQSPKFCLNARKYLIAMNSNSWFKYSPMHIAFSLQNASSAWWEWCFLYQYRTSVWYLSKH